MAVLDVNSAVNPNGLPVATGAGGPYKGIVNQGGNMTITVSGEPNQPVILLSGALNVGAAAFPQGQLDIGGPPNPMTGIPSGIGVVANGASPTSFFDVFFVLDASGKTEVTLAVPSLLPVGSLGAIQAVNLVSTPNVIAISNAVEICVQ
jgi:hypothetical protein